MIKVMKGDKLVMCRAQPGLSAKSDPKTCMSGMQAGRIGADHLAAYFHCQMAELHLKQGKPDQADSCLAKAAALGGRRQECS